MSTIQAENSNSAAEALFFGLTFALFFYGITCAQVFYYCWHYPKDRCWLKHMVAMLWSLDSAIVALNAVIFWKLIIKHLGGPYTYYKTRSEDMSNNSVSQYPGFANMLLMAEFICTAVVELSVQCYYIYSIWATSAHNRHRIVTVILPLLLATTSFLTGIITVVYASLDNQNIPGFGCPMEGGICKAPPISHLVAATTTDIVVTVLSYYNFKHSTTASRGTDHMLKKLKIFIIERGLLTTVAQICEVSAYLASLDTHVNQYLWLVFQFIDSKIYVNSVLSLLNARNYLRDIGSSVGHRSTLHTIEESEGSQTMYSTFIELSMTQQPTGAEEGRGWGDSGYQKTSVMP